MASWDKLTPHQKVQSVHIDMMRHPQYALLSGVTMVGKLEVSDKIETACTNGRDTWYNDKWVESMNRKQLRYVVIHENMHKALRHCTEYTAISKEYPDHCRVAADYVVNGLIEEMDPKLEFVERPTKPFPPLIDKKYAGWSFVRVLKQLLKEYPPPPQGQGGDGQGKPSKGQKGDGKGKPMPGSFDEHDMGEDEGTALTPEEVKQATREIEDAVRQGKLLQEKLAGNEAGGADVSALTQERDTRWKEHLREFVMAIIAGDDNSRFCPPNKRFLPLGFVMPSHFSENMGELHIYCDTSGSMTGVYPIVFGEIVQICKDARPDKVRVIWWDMAVCGEQVFEPKDYDQMTTMLQPKGGGGTTPDCVKPYVEGKKYKAKAGIWLSDGEFYTSAVELPWPSLWGIVGNPDFKPKFGKLVNIDVKGY